MSARAGSLPLLGGDLSLDFCNTASGQGTADATDHLDGYDDFLAWAVHASVLTSAAVAGMAGRLDDRAKAAALATVLEVRTALTGALGRIASGRPVPPRAMAAVNRFLSGAWEGARLEATPDGFELCFPEPGGTPDHLLRPILRSAAKLLETADPGRIKACPGAGCGWLFHDATKSSNRTWCEMRVCGSRAKAGARKKPKVGTVSG